MTTKLPTRGDVALAEATRDPIFLLQTRRWRISQEGLPSSVVFDFDACDLRQGDEFISIDTFAERFPDRVEEDWRAERVFFTREEGEAWATRRSYRWPSGWRVYCLCAEGDLAKLLRARSLKPTGDLETKGVGA